MLIDLCARLPYNVIVRCYFIDGGGEEVLDTTDISNLLYNEENREFPMYKPYLCPMSFMTEEEFLEYHKIKYNKVTYRHGYKRIDVGKFHNVGIIPIEDYVDWLNAHHFDYRGLIEKSLAIVAPDNMYK